MGAPSWLVGREYISESKHENMCNKISAVQCVRTASDSMSECAHCRMMQCVRGVCTVCIVCTVHVCSVHSVTVHSEQCNDTAMEASGDWRICCSQRSAADRLEGDDLGRAEGHFCFN